MPSFEMTPNQLHTAFCLIVRGELYPRQGSKHVYRTSDPETEFNFTLKLNNALNKSNFDADVSSRDVSLMVKQLLREERHAPHKRGFLTGTMQNKYSGLLETSCARRVTRKLQMTWDRLRMEAGVHQRKQERKRKEHCRRHGIPYVESESPLGALAEAPAQREGYKSQAVEGGDLGVACQDVLAAVQHNDSAAPAATKFSFTEVALARAERDAKLRQRKEARAERKAKKEAAKSRQGTIGGRVTKKAADVKGKKFLSAEFVGSEDDE